MKRLASLLLTGIVALGIVSCGDGPESNTPAAERTPVPGTATPRITPGGSPTINIPPDFGPAPTLGGNIVKISPAHAEKVKQNATRTTNPQRPSGLCADVTFEGLPENAQWFRIAFDGQEVTPKLVWIIASQNNPTEGRVCYAPDEGFTVGKHAVAISVQNPRNPTQAPKQTVGWAFEVIP